MKLSVMVIAVMGIQSGVFADLPPHSKTGTNLVSFETRDGKKYLGVRIVSTNKDGLVIKVPGELGFKKEMFTNLPPMLAGEAKRGMPPTKEQQTADARAEFRRTNEFLVRLNKKLGELTSDERDEQAEVYMEAAEMCRKRGEEIGALVESLPSKQFYAELAVYETLPNLKVMELNDEVANAKNWDDYIEDRISRLEFKKRERAREIGSLTAMNAREATAQARKAEVARAYERAMASLLMEAEEILVYQRFLIVGMAKINAATREQLKSLREEMAAERESITK